MLANVEAMLRTIQNFLRLATPEERIEFASALYNDKEIYNEARADGSQRPSSGDAGADRVPAESCDRTATCVD